MDLKMLEETFPVLCEKRGDCKEGGRVCLPYIFICQRNFIDLSIDIPEGLLDMVLRIMI